MNLIELLGITRNAEALQKVGMLLRWYEVLTFAGVIFAISEFMEKNKLRSYRFKFSNLSKDVFELIILAISSVIVANFLPLFNFKPFVIPLIHYPTFWEILGLCAFSIALIIIIVFSLFPYSHIPRLTRKNALNFFVMIRNVILNDQSEESFSAISVILDKNLDTIMQYAAQYDKHWDIQGSHYKSPFDRNKIPKKYYDLVEYSRQIIEVAMSDRYYCRYLSENNIGVVLRIIAATNKYKLWHSCGYVFFNSLCKELFLNGESHLSRENEFRGVGLHKPVYKALFTAFGILDWYRPFQSFSYWRDDLPPRKWTQRRENGRIAINSQEVSNGAEETKAV